MAQLLFKQKHVYEDGAIVEMRAWIVPKTSRTPDGVNYSLVYIDPQGERILGYDNAEGKGHHRHDRNKETDVSFESIERLCSAFMNDVERLRRKNP
jgi:hypothetical protein